MDSTQGSCCYDLEFPIPRESARQTDAQRWFVRKHKAIRHDNFMAHFDDWALGCEAWLYTQHGKVEYLPGATLRFGRHRGVMLAPLSLVAPFPSLKDEYDDWNKPGFYHATACHGSQTISGQLSGGLTCVLHIYPFQMARLKSLAEHHDIPGMQSFLGAHARACLDETKDW